MATKKPTLPEGWTDTHEDALKTLTALGLGKNYGTQLLTGSKEKNLDDMVNAALRSHAMGKKLVPIPGGPRGAVPIVPQTNQPPQQLARQQSPRPQPQAEPPPQPGVWSGQQLAGGLKLPRTPPPAPVSFGGGPSSMAQQLAGQGPSAATAQTRPAPPLAGGAPTKPRIRVPAAGRRIPAAPLGSPTQGPETPQVQTEKPPSLPLIHSSEEYEQLAPGTEFIWKSDGHIYEKPAQKGE
jgi:hypothetical protein